MHEWRITQTTIEAEMLRLAALLAYKPQPAAHGALRRQEARASNAALQSAILAVAANRLRK